MNFQAELNCIEVNYFRDDIGLRVFICVNVCCVCCGTVSVNSSEFGMCLKEYILEEKRREGQLL